MVGDWYSGKDGVGQVVEGGLYTLVMVCSSLFTIVYSSELLATVEMLVMLIFTYVVKQCFATWMLLMLR